MPLTTSSARLLACGGTEAACSHHSFAHRWHGSPLRWRGAKSFQQTYSKVLADTRLSRDVKHIQWWYLAKIVVWCLIMCNAHVDPSDKQALMNVSRAFCISGSRKQLNLQQEQTYQKQQDNFFLVRILKKGIAKGTVSNLQRLIALLMFSISMPRGRALGEALVSHLVQLNRENLLGSGVMTSTSCWRTALSLAWLYKKPRYKHTQRAL